MAATEVMAPKFTDLTPEEIAALHRLGHQTAIPTADGRKTAVGYSGVIRGCQSSWWLTGQIAVILDENGQKTTKHQPDGQAY